MILHHSPVLQFDGIMIEWMESKASFGDVATMNESYTKQFSAYERRFGPGLVIYWFGFVHDAADLQVGKKNFSLLLLCRHGQSKVCISETAFRR